MKKKNKNVKVKKEAELIKVQSDETDQVRTFVFILIGVAIVAVALYFLSSQYLVKDGIKDDEEEKTEEVSIAYNNVNVGNVFNRVEDEYYVFAYDPDALQASYYAAILNNYDNTKVNMYFLNLSIEVNKAYVKEEGNSKATKASELAIKAPTLIKIKNGKIDKYIENIEEIEKELR